MGHSKETLIGRIKHHLAEANKHIAKPIQLPDEVALLPMTLIRAAHKWLENLEALTEMRKYRRNAPDWYWNSLLNDPDCEEFFEVKLYRTYQEDLNRCFRMTSRPDLLKPTVLTKLLKALSK